MVMDYWDLVICMQGHRGATAAARPARSAGDYLHQVWCQLQLQQHTHPRRPGEAGRYRHTLQAGGLLTDEPLATTPASVPEGRMPLVVNPV